jgi:hypothetical protein
LNRQISLQSGKGPNQEEDEEMNIRSEKTTSNMNTTEMATLDKKPRKNFLRLNILEVGQSQPLGTGKKVIKKVPLSEANKMIAAGVARLTQSVANGLTTSPGNNTDKVSVLQQSNPKKGGDKTSYQQVSSGANVNDSSIDSYSLFDIKLSRLEAGEFEKK